MIKGVELRMGNWVYHGDDPKPVQYVPVYDFEDLNPIPLDEEWLNKFGFKIWGNSSFNTDYSYEGGDVDCMLRKKPEGYLWLSEDWDEVNPQNPMQYVHQLQNLFLDLTGKQLIDVSLPTHNATTNRH